MSYILDALRRAEAERGRGGVPGLHTQAAPLPGALPTEARTAPSRLLATALAVLGVAALATVGTWWALQRSAPAGGVVLAGAQPAASPPARAASEAPPGAPAPSAPSAASSVASPAAPPPVAPATAPAPAPRSAPAAVRERPPAPVIRAPAPEVPRTRAAAAPAERAPAPASPRQQDPAPAAPTGTVFAQSDLPDAVRAQLPVLKISGASYSTNPTYRMAIVNGQVLHEGDLAAPGLMLEKIEPGRTIWSFKGYRYGLASQ